MASIYNIQFIFKKNVNKKPYILIIAVRQNKLAERYEIEIKGMTKIKKIMNKFDNQYERIVEHLRIMGEQMVLLNP